MNQSTPVPNAPGLITPESISRAMASLSSYPDYNDWERFEALATVSEMAHCSCPLKALSVGLNGLAKVPKDRGKQRDFTRDILRSLADEARANSRT